MGFFDFLKRGSSPPAEFGDKRVSSLAKVVGDKRAQTYDRTEAIRELGKMQSREAAQALLKRFTFTMDPSITDQEEKEAAYEGIVAVGEDAIEAVLAFCDKAEVLTWPIRILREILDDEGYKEKLLLLAKDFDTDYTRNVEPKLQVIGALEEVRGDDVRACVEEFLRDVNESVRYHAVQSTFAQRDEQRIGALLDLFCEEESVRIKNKICDGFVLKSWKAPAERLETVREAMSDVYDYALGGDGSFSKRG